MRRHLIVSLLALSVLAVGCYAADESKGPDDSNFAVAVAALSGSDVTNACYRLTTTDGMGNVAWTMELCGDEYGFGTDVSYVGVCDADADTANHTITLELLGLYDAAGEIPASEYTNPCPEGAGCTMEAICLANADVPVHFDLTILFNANWGFFDYSIDMEFIECSAKFDCVNPDGAPIELLHKPDGTRGQTLILGFVCTPDGCSEPGQWMYMDDITLTCDEGVAIISPAGIGPATVTQDANLVYGAMIYKGGEGLTPAAYYTNLAIGFNGGTNCSIQTSATTADVPLAGLSIPDGMIHPAIGWDLDVTGPEGELFCARHPLDGQPGGVSTFYPMTTDARTFDNEIFFEQICEDPGPVDPCGGQCAAGSTCVDGVCVVIAERGLRFTLQWDNATDLDLHIVTPGGQHVFYSNLVAAGCWLDADNTAGGGGSVENINCQADDALFVPGVYEYWVTNFTFGNGPADYTLSVYVDEALAAQFAEGVSDAGPPSDPFDPSRPASIIRTISY